MRNEKQVNYAVTSNGSPKLRLNGKSYWNEITRLRGHAVTAENHAEVNNEDLTPQNPSLVLVFRI